MRVFDLTLPALQPLTTAAAAAAAAAPAPRGPRGTRLPRATRLPTGGPGPPPPANPRRRNTHTLHRRPHRRTKPPPSGAGRRPKKRETISTQGTEPHPFVSFEPPRLIRGAKVDGSKIGAAKICFHHPGTGKKTAGQESIEIDMLMGEVEDPDI